MANFAEIDENGVVLRVIVADQDFINSGVVGDPSRWVETSDSTRKNYAGIGYTYDQARDAFIPPKPRASFILDEEKAQWVAPVEMPKDGGEYTWDENTGNWLSKE
jgi:hypothetical protein